ncbi:MAG TPA: lysophospholipid acyltransferase family protein [Candidatus Methylomirabilis sp.]|nr:lysophospholipid acyltransferase family protein [Candidatus Methylomirabilis sp.]
MTLPDATAPSPHDGVGEPANASAASATSAHYDTRLPDLPWSRRIQIPLIAAAVYSLIRLLGPTLRFEVHGWQNAERVHASGKRCIWAFWHRIIIPIVWWHRDHGVVVMNTTAFDGQWTRKVIEWLGFGTAQGSSSRGGLRGLAVMARRLEEGVDCAFTIDGPRGPRYVAKPGPVMLARKTGCPVLVFHIGVSRGKTFKKTWDHFLLPAPFARAVILFAPPIYVPADATAEMLEAKHREMQLALDRVRDIAEGWYSLTEDQRQNYRTEFSK